MKALFFVLLVAAVAAGITLATLDNPGYVLIARDPWSVDMSLVVFLFLLGITLVAGTTVLRLFLRILNTPRDVARWRALRRARKARESLMLGLAALLEGNWRRAEKDLLSHLRGSETPVLHTLAAAFAAQGEGDLEKRDGFLAQAQQVAPDQGFLIGLAQAQMQLDARQYERALATVNQLRTQAPKHGHVLRLLVHIYRELHDWENLANLLPDARRHGGLAGPEADALELLAHRELLNQALPKGAIASLRHAWNAASKRARENPEVVAVYARQLLHQGEQAECAQLLEQVLKREWNDELAEIFGRCAAPDAARQLASAEAWLRHQGESATLLLALGRLARRAGQEERAHDYLRRATELGTMADAHQELGEVLLGRGQQAEAVEQFRRALVLCHTREAAGRKSAAGRPDAGPRRGAHYGY